jgi:hypothetical protein
MNIFEGSFLHENSDASLAPPRGRKADVVEIGFPILQRLRVTA